MNNEAEFWKEIKSKRRIQQEEGLKKRRAREEEEENRRRQQDDWSTSIANPTSPISIAIDIATPGGLF